MKSKPVLTVGEKFKDARLVHSQHGKETQEQVADHVGISKSIIRALEQDTCRDVGYSTIAKLANYYDVSIDYLIGSADSPTLDPDIRNAMAYTGLSEKAVGKLHAAASSAEATETLNEFIESKHFDRFIELLNASIRLWQKDEFKGFPIPPQKFEDDSTILLSFQDAADLYKQNACEKLQIIINDLREDY